MTIKRRKAKSRKAFGTRREYRQKRGRIFVACGWFAGFTADECTIGVDPGGKDKTAIAIVSPTGRLIFHDILRRPQEDAQLEFYRASFQFPKQREPAYTPVLVATNYMEMEARIMARLIGQFEAIDSRTLIDAARELAKMGAIAAPSDNELLADLRSIKKTD